MKETEERKGMSSMGISVEKYLTKETKITQDKSQTRSTIPKVFVDKHKVTSKDSMEWDDKDGKLKGVLKNDKK